MRKNDDVLRTWGEIGQYVGGVSDDTLRRYERDLNLPVRRSGKGPRAVVYALREELDQWLRDEGRFLGIAPQSATTVRAGATPATPTDVALKILNRIQTLSKPATLYRQDYRLRVEIEEKSPTAVLAKIECEFDLLNATDRPQPFVQEITIDDGESGRVASMVMRKNGGVLYEVLQPKIAEKRTGHASYQGPKQVIDPSSASSVYTCIASWVITRKADDIWYNHMILPTSGISLETTAPADFTITKPFSHDELLLAGERIDVAWNRRRAMTPIVRP